MIAHQKCKTLVEGVLLQSVRKSVKPLCACFLHTPGNLLVFFDEYIICKATEPAGTSFALKIFCLQSLAPGVRVSWLTAHPDVTTKVLYHSHGVAMGPCSLSQVGF